MFLNTDPFRVSVNNEDIFGTERHGLSPGRLVGVTAISGRPLLFTVHLDSGALFGRLYIDSLRCERFGAKGGSLIFRTKDLQPWSCLDGPCSYTVISYLKDSAIKAKIGGREVRGNYLFSVDYYGGGLAEDPVQYKAHHVVVLENGQLAALPNNNLIFINKFETGEINDWPQLKRQTRMEFVD